jgi:hypothetical protein
MSNLYGFCHGFILADESQTAPCMIWLKERLLPAWGDPIAFTFKIFRINFLY